MNTTLIRNGTIIDGTGARGYTGHLLMEHDRIAAVVRAEEDAPPAASVIDAKGKVVAPGFIDAHSHVDWILPSSVQVQLLASLLEQGVTTVVAGNCGISPAPVRPAGVALIERLAGIAIEEPLAYDWVTLGEYLERVEACGPAVNLAELVGHAALRYAMAEKPRGEMDAHEVRACLQQARQSLDEGACGLSLGLGYDPGMYSPPEELASFGAVAAGVDKPLTVHLKAFSRVSPCYPITDRPWEAHNVRALAEILDLARATGVRLQLSHFIIVGRKSWPTASRCLEMVEQARRDGVDVMIDAFPFTCGNTTVNALLPHWYLADLRRKSQSRWALARLRLELEIGFRLVGFGPGDLRLMLPAIDGWEAHCGLTLPEIARRRTTTPFATLLELSSLSRGAAVMLYSTYSGDDGEETVLEQVLGKDYCLFESDAVLRRSGFPNPAARGTFPRILGPLTRDRRLFSLESALHRMTAATAERFGLTRRGRLSRGFAADVVVFDPDTISDQTPIAGQPAGRPQGVETVFVNGVMVVEQGRARADRGAGRVLRV